MLLLLHREGQERENKLEKTAPIDESDSVGNLNLQKSIFTGGHEICILCQRHHPGLKTSR